MRSLLRSPPNFIYIFAIKKQFSWEQIKMQKKKPDNKIFNNRQRQKYQRNEGNQTESILKFEGQRHDLVLWSLEQENLSIDFKVTRFSWVESRSKVILGSKTAIKDQRTQCKASGSNLRKKDHNPLKKSMMGLEVREEKCTVGCGSHSGESSFPGKHEGRSTDSPRIGNSNNSFWFINVWSAQR